MLAISSHVSLSLHRSEQRRRLEERAGRVNAGRWRRDNLTYAFHRQPRPYLMAGSKLPLTRRCVVLLHLGHCIGWMQKKCQQIVSHVKNLRTPLGRSNMSEEELLRLKRMEATPAPELFFGRGMAYVAKADHFARTNLAHFSHSILSQVVRLSSPTPVPTMNPRACARYSRQSGVPASVSRVVGQARQPYVVVNLRPTDTSLSHVHSCPSPALYSGRRAARRRSNGGGRKC
jgi:hypothetical protein